MKMILCKIRISDKKIVDKVSIADSKARPCFFEYNGILYLTHSINNREVCEFIKVNTDNLSNSEVVMNSTVELIYPSVVIYDDKVYCVATGNASASVYARKLEMPIFTTDDVSNILLNIIKNYDVGKN